MTKTDSPLDQCSCGHFRKDHHSGGCGFRLWRTEADYADNHPQHHAEMRTILDAVTEKVLSYRPVDKGLAAKKTKRKLARKAKRDD
jgi:hypothetical protein